MIFENSELVIKEPNIIYTNNLNYIKNRLNGDSQFIKSNSFILTDYNIDTIKGNYEYKGTAYELYFVDNERNLQRLSYNIQEGNGIILNELRLYLGIDNDTIKKKTSSGELYIDDTNIRYAYKDYPGILRGDNEKYYDILYDTNIPANVKNGTIVSTAGTITLNSAIKNQLSEITQYYDKIAQLDSIIKNIRGSLLGEHEYKVGDVLYRTNDGILTHNSISNGINNTPYMVCVIGSNILDDTYPRFIPIVSNSFMSRFSNSRELSFKNSYSQVPVFNTEWNYITSSTQIIGNDYGFIATNQNNWNTYLHNKLNPNEHYFSNSSDSETSSQNLVTLYLDSDNVNKDELYVLGVNSVTSDKVIGEELYDGFKIHPTFYVKFDDGATRYYNDATLEYKEEYGQFTNTDILRGALKALPNTKTPDNQLGLSTNNSVEHNEEIIPDNLKKYVKTNQEANIPGIFGKVSPSIVSMSVDGLQQDAFLYSNEFYYGGCGGGGGGCGSNSVCYRCSCNSECTCNGQCGTNCDRDPNIDKPVTTKTTNYSFRVTINSNLSENYKKVYLKLWANETMTFKSNPYIIEYTNSSKVQELTTYNSITTSSEGYVKAVAYANSSFLDESPYYFPILGISNFTKKSETSSEISYYKEIVIEHSIGLNPMGCLPIEGRKMGKEYNDEEILDDFEDVIKIEYSDDIINNNGYTIIYYSINTSGVTFDRTTYTGTIKAESININIPSNLIVFDDYLNYNIEGYFRIGSGAVNKITFTLDSSGHFVNVINSIEMYKKQNKITNSSDISFNVGINSALTITEFVIENIYISGHKTPMSDINLNTKGNIN